MKASIKTPTEISSMQEGGRKLSQTLDQLIKLTKPGVNLAEIEAEAQELIAKAGGEPGFAMVPGYDWATCVNLNEGIVHGIPDEKIIKAGDVASIDIGNFYQGFHTDMSRTFQVGGQKNKEIDNFLKTGKETLEKAIAQVKPGNRVGHISQTIQRGIESQGYSCMRNLTGHGIGKNLHEYPQIPCFLSMALEQTPLLKEGMTIAIEVIYAQGDYQTITSDQDKWTIVTADGKIAAIFEKTIAVTSDGFKILTP